MEFLHDADEQVGEDDDEEEHVPELSCHEHQDEHDQVDAVEERERVPADDLSYRLGPCCRVDIHKACGHALGNILGTESPHVVLVSMGAGICHSLSHVPITPHMVAARTLRCVP